MTGASPATGATGSNVAPGITLAGETRSATPQQSTQEQGGASGNSTQEQKN
jgi:hypothetical protein